MTTPANTLTGLIPVIYEAMDIVSREQIGFIPAVSRDSSAERAALNQTITIPVTEAQALVDTLPSVTPPDAGDQTIDAISMTISKSKSMPIRWTGEQQVGMMSSGTYERVLRDQFAQGFRALANAVEADLFAAAYQGASRAYGTAGTAPFGTAGDMSDLAQIRKILEDNGAPTSDLQFVGGSSATANLRGKQSLLLKVNESGSDALLRRGALSELPIEGFMMHNSGAVKAVTKGTGTSYVTNGAVASGVSDVVLKTGSGTVLAGDVVTFADDSANKYVVNTGVAAAGTISLGKPGLLTGISDGNAMTIGGNYTPNVAFSRSAIQLITRAPARPVQGDSAVDVMLVQDPISGLVFEVSQYPGHRLVLFEVALAWGCKAIKSNHIATLMG